MSAACTPVYTTTPAIPAIRYSAPGQVDRQWFARLATDQATNLPFTPADLQSVIPWGHCTHVEAQQFFSWLITCCLERYAEATAASGSGPTDYLEEIAARFLQDMLDHFEASAVRHNADQVCENIRTLCGTDPNTPARREVATGRLAALTDLLTALERHPYLDDPAALEELGDDLHAWLEERSEQQQAQGAAEAALPNEQ